MCVGCVGSVWGVCGCLFFVHTKKPLIMASLSAVPMLQFVRHAFLAMLVVAPASGHLKAYESPDFPTGRWAGEDGFGIPSGLLGNPNAHAPLLGNGYLGVTLSSQRRGLLPLPEPGASVDLWLNSNSNWDCESSHKALPPARCSVRVLGGLSVAVLGPGFANDSALETEQRVHNGTLWTRRVARDGGTVETESFVDPEENVLITEVRLTTPPSAATATIEATLWAYGRNRHVRTSTHAECTSTGAAGGTTGWVGGCSRRYHALNSTRSFRAPWSALALTSDGSSPSAVVRGNVTLFVADVHYLAATFPPSGATGLTVRLVAALADNVLRSSDDDPTADAMSLARSSRAADVRQRSGAFWRRYWNASTVVLPTRPALSAMWYGGLYATATAFPDERMQAKMRGRAPPPGLCAAPLASSERELPWASPRRLARPPCLPPPPNKRAHARCSILHPPSSILHPPCSILHAPCSILHARCRYGPFVTGDFAWWNGDYTLDYNYQGTFYHVFASNHPERAAGYFGPILDFVPAARAMAQQAATEAHLSGCASNALRFATHLAPWGYQSRDTSAYGYYEGAFAALLFIDHWEVRSREARQWCDVAWRGERRGDAARAVRRERCGASGAARAARLAECGAVWRGAARRGVARPTPLRQPSPLSASSSELLLATAPPPSLGPFVAVHA